VLTGALKGRDITPQASRLTRAGVAPGDNLAGVLARKLDEPIGVQGQIHPIFGGILRRVLERPLHLTDLVVHGVFE
jgi:hypothetical protein